MKKLLFLLIIVISSIQIQAQDTAVTTYYLIRHAEKVRADSSNKNPNLTEKGKSRAQNWSTVFKDVNFDMVYSTNYNRTIQTATPTANEKNLEIQFYNPKALFDSNFQSKTKGKTVLVVGHSNTTPQFVNKILAEERYANIGDSNNSNLYIVTIINEETAVTLLNIRH